MGTGRRTRRPGKTAAAFVLAFAAAVILFEVAFLALVIESEAFAGYLSLTARISATLLRVLGVDAEAVGRTVVSQQFAVDIRNGCDAIQPSGFFVIAVLLSPAAWRERVAVACVGTTVLLTVNVVRVVSLFLVGLYIPVAFRFFHLDFWQAAFVVLATGLWLFWSLSVARRELRPA